MDTAHTNIKTKEEASILALGSRINSMEKERNHGLMVLYLKANMFREKSKVSGTSGGQTVTVIKVTFIIINSTAKVPTFGMTDVVSLVLGRTIKWKERESLNGQMVVDILVTMLQTSRLASECLNGQLVSVLKDNGLMVFNTD